MSKFTKVVIGLGIAALAFAPALAQRGNGSNAQVRVAHLSPDAPPVDVIVNDAITAFVDTKFGEIRDYETLPAGEYNLKVVPTGMSTPAVINADVNLFYNRDYTVVAVNFLDDIAPVVLEDDNRPVSVNSARVRFFHGSPDAPAVDIAVTGGPVLFGDVEFTKVGDYVTVPAGTYDLEVRLAGTDTVVLPLPGIALDGGTVYTAYAIGSVVEGTLGAALSADSFNPSINRARDGERVFEPGVRSVEDTDGFAETAAPNRFFRGSRR
jgi:hypothetical protein